jgi:hypothetical protein
MTLLSDTCMSGVSHGCKDSVGLGFWVGRSAPHSQKYV